MLVREVIVVAEPAISVPCRGCCRRIYGDRFLRIPYATRPWSSGVIGMRLRTARRRAGLERVAAFVRTCDRKDAIPGARGRGLRRLSGYSEDSCGRGAHLESNRKSVL